MRHKKKKELFVSKEAIEDFWKLNSTERLGWLDEMRDFLSKAIPTKTQKAAEVLRKKGW